jgi:hypothetical protein
MSGTAFFAQVCYLKSSKVTALHPKRKIVLAVLYTIILKGTFPCKWSKMEVYYSVKSIILKTVHDFIFRVIIHSEWRQDLHNDG